MNSSRPATPVRIAVIGGGFSGLAGALRLQELAAQTRISLFEASGRLGGVARTEERDGFLIEHGADMFTTRETWGMDLCRRINFDGELINTNRENARAFVVHRGRLYPVPEGFSLMTPGRMWPLAKTGLLSPLGKLRIASEYFIPPRRDDADESLAQFVTRRLGREAYDRLVQPLIGGIYTADPTKLSMQAALPAFVQMERQHGSLIRALRRAPRQAHDQRSSGARYGLFVAPKRGMESLVQAIARCLPDGAIRLNAPIQSITRTLSGNWDILVQGAFQPERFDAVLIATPAHATAELLEHVSSTLADELRGIPYASAAIVALGFRRDQIKHPLDGFGIVVPQIENRRFLAASLASVKFNGRAPEGHVLMRVFIGGACQPELTELPDDALRQLAIQELDDLLTISGPPLLSEVIRWPRAMPQYHVGHLDRVARIETELASFTNLALAGNAYRGVGIPFCIHSGEQAAERLLGDLLQNGGQNDGGQND